MKYIIIDEQGIEVGIMFAEILKHDSVAAGHKYVSAGYCDRDGNTRGFSTSLGMRPRPEDAAILKHTIEFRY